MKKFEPARSEDCTKIPSLTKEGIRLKVLQNITLILESMEKKINNYTITNNKVNLSEK